VTWQWIMWMPIGPTTWLVLQVFGRMMMSGVMIGGMSIGRTGTDDDVLTHLTEYGLTRGPHPPAMTH